MKHSQRQLSCGRDLLSWNQLLRNERQYYAFVVFSLLESFHPGLVCATSWFSQQIQIPEAQRFYTKIPI